MSQRIAGERENGLKITQQRKGYFINQIIAHLRPQANKVRNYNRIMHFSSLNQHTYTHIYTCSLDLSTLQTCLDNTANLMPFDS